MKESCSIPDGEHKETNQGKHEETGHFRWSRKPRKQTNVWPEDRGVKAVVIAECPRITVKGRNPRHAPQHVVHAEQTKGYTKKS